MTHALNGSNKRTFTKTSITRLSGILLLFALVTSFVAAGFAGSVGEYNVAPDRVSDTLQRVANNQGLHQAEIGFDLASYVLTVALSGVLYLAFSAHDQPSALLGSLGLAAGGIILAVHDIPWFVLPSIAQDFMSASGAEIIVLQSTGRMIMLTANWGLSVGVTFLGLGILVYGILIVSSGIAPRALGWLGIVSGVLLSAGVWLPRIDEGLYFVWVLLAIPYALWQLGLGIWLLARGTAKASHVESAQRVPAR
jgi:hypothetical protein